MKWATQVNSSGDYLGRFPTAPPRPFRIKRLETQPSTNSGDWPLLVQHFLAPLVLEDPTGIIQVEVSDEEVLNITKMELVPHFQDVKALYVEGQLQTLILHQLKPRSTEMFFELLHRNQLDPFVQSLRGNQPTDVSYRYDIPKHFHWYEINKALFQPVHHDGFQKLWEFLLKGSDFSRSGVLLITPTDWRFEDKLFNSFALQLIVHAAQRTFLAVDPLEKRVHYISCLME